MVADSLLHTVRSIVSQPTAPFHEHAVRVEIVMHLAQCPHVTVEQDDFGNVIARYRRGQAEARFAFAAHMDHPVVDVISGRRAEKYREKNPPIRDFGAFAMWDLPAFEVRDDRFYSRLVTISWLRGDVAMFHELNDGAEGAVDGLFTRAEEVDSSGRFTSRKAASSHVGHVVSIETSSEKFGGSRWRRRDRARWRQDLDLDSPASAMRWQLRTAPEYRQRALMSGGTCEATAFQLYEYRTAALCVALGNYHNCGPGADRKRVVSVEDVHSLMQLCVAALNRVNYLTPRLCSREVELGSRNIAVLGEPPVLIFRETFVPATLLQLAAKC